MSLVTKVQIEIVLVSVICISIFVAIMMFRILKRTKFRINIINCIKYDSVYLFAEISMFVIYLFGLKNSFNFGEKYILATSFATLITDTQWDIAYAIKTVTQMIAIILAFLDINAFGECFTGYLQGGDLVLNFVVTIMMIIQTIATIFSGIDYLQLPKIEKALEENNFVIKMKMQEGRWIGLLIARKPN